MGQRSKLCAHQIFDLDSNPSDSCLHPDQSFFAGTPDYANRNSNPVLSGSGNSVDLLHQFRHHHERVMFCGNQYTTNQICHAIQNLGLGAIVPSNIYNANMLLAPCGRVFPVHRNNIMPEERPSSSISQTNHGIDMDAFRRHNQLVGCDRGSCKRKNLAVIPEIYYNPNRSASSSSTSHRSLSSQLPQWEQSYESVTGLMHPTTLTPPEYGGRASLPGAEGSYRSIRGRSVAINIHQPESAFPSHQNCLHSGSYIMQPFQPANNTWVSQFGNGNNLGDGNSTWSCNYSSRYLPGRSQNPGPLQMVNMNIQAFAGGSSGTNSAMFLHPSSMPNGYPAAHNIPNHSYSHHAYMPGSYLHPFNNFLTSTDQIYRPQQLPQPSQQFRCGSLRILSSEDTGLVDFSGFYEVGNAIDLHHDMRLDIDDMSYEELLALEEQIGVVKTGLAEDCIMKNLKTRIHVHQETALTSEQSFISSIEKEACTVCQVEYEENEIIGTLDCGHTYHSECIKQWLLIKNLCPICKTTALAG